MDEEKGLTMYMSWILLTSWEVSPSSPASRFLLVGVVEEEEENVKDMEKKKGKDEIEGSGSARELRGRKMVV